MSRHAAVCLVRSPSCQWMSLACVCGVVLSPSCQQLPWCAWCFHRAASICAQTCTCVVVAMSMFDWDDIELPAVSTPRKKPKTLKFGAVFRLTEHQKMPTTEMDELPTPAKHNPRFAKKRTPAKAKPESSTNHELIMIIMCARASNDAQIHDRQQAAEAVKSTTATPQQQDVLV